MLNKNQSKKRNYWKFYAVIPALIAFVFLFQIKTVAQEKSSVNIHNIDPNKIQSVDITKISKTTTDAEIEKMVKRLKEQNDIIATISNLKRNSENQIISIQIELKSKKGSTKVQKTITENGIDVIGIIVINEKNGAMSFDFTDKNGQKNEDKASAEDAEIEISNTQNSNILIAPPTPPIPPSFPSGPMPTPPPADMSKMPKPPVAPSNPKDKQAMKNFEKEMAEFEKKMEAYEPDMSAYEKEVDEIMAKREAIYDKEMEKYDLAMEKYHEVMEKYNEQNEKIIEMRYEKDVKQHDKDMKQYQKDRIQMEKNKQKAKETKSKGA